MLTITKALHIIGVALFFGSILGHAITGLAEGVHGDAQAVLVARQILNVATWYLTLPGLVLVTLTGIGLVVIHERPQTNLRPHLLIAALIFMNAIFILLPTGQAILGTANELATGSGNASKFANLRGREAMFGAINILLCIVAIFIGVLKPGSTQN
ncbi:MAG: DUF2269 family protein [bacterium]|nr:DUF2269 family protein [bacterium]